MSDFDKKLKGTFRRIFDLLQTHKHNVRMDNLIYLKFMESHAHIIQKRKQIRDQDRLNLNAMVLELTNKDKEFEEDEKIPY